MYSVNEAYFVSRTIVIDAGKTFQAASIEWFPQYGLRKIDAVLITHGHADGRHPLTLVFVRISSDHCASSYVWSR
jgi:L-ascorbate metabolism protein UlaG (beta-lactamase superfamily)